MRGSKVQQVLDVLSHRIKWLTFEIEVICLLRKSNQLWIANETEMQLK